MTHIHSYSKVYNLGHPQIDSLFDTPVVVQEKIDGSQFSFMWDETGQLHARSKGAHQYGPERWEPDQMFQKAIDYLLVLGCPAGLEGLVFRAELLNTPKHNTIAYDRAPTNNLMLFDVEDGEYRFTLDREVMGLYAEQLGIELIPQYRLEAKPSLEVFKSFIANTDSVLGGAKIEGVVIKAYDQFTKDGKVMMGKYVSEAFKEKHSRDWKKRNPSRTDIVQHLQESLNTEARWRKAVQHLAEAGQLEHSPRDIGALMKELKRDTEEEEIDWITEKLIGFFLPQVMKGVGRGMPEWYKEQLMERQFNE